MTTACEINEAALDAVDSHNVYLAQTLFRQNYKKNPCFMTMNNLGVFHVFEGLLKPDNRGRGASKLGIHYLNKAALMQTSSLTLQALGWAYFSPYFFEKDYVKAGDYFEKACKIELDYESIYNYAVCKYMYADYRNATVWFEKALELCNPFNYIDTFIYYTFALFYDNSDEFLTAYRKVLVFDDEDIIGDKLILSYYAGDLQTIEYCLTLASMRFNFDVIELAIIFDFMIECGKTSEAENYFKHEIECRKDSGTELRSEMSILKKLFMQADYRKKVIGEYRRRMQLIKQCCYYECKKHNPI